MLNITMAGRTGKYVSLTKVTNKKGEKINQAVFTLYSKGYDGETTEMTCIYSGISDKMIQSLFIKQGVNDKGTTQYHSRSLYIVGTLISSLREQELLVAGFDDEYETVLAPSVAVHVNVVEFLDASPGKKEASATDGDKEALAEKRNRRKNKNKDKDVVANDENEIEAEIEDELEGKVSDDIADKIASKFQAVKA